MRSWGRVDDSPPIDSLIAYYMKVRVNTDTMVGSSIGVQVKGEMNRFPVPSRLGMGALII